MVSLRRFFCAIKEDLKDLVDHVELLVLLEQLVIQVQEELRRLSVSSHAVLEQLLDVELHWWPVEENVIPHALIGLFR